VSIDPTPSILELASKDLLDADTLLFVREHVTTRDADDEDDDEWDEEERERLLHSIDVCLNRLCPLFPNTHRLECGRAKVEAAFLDSTWEDLAADEVASSFENILEHVQYLCAYHPPSRKKWRHFWLLVEESLPAWLEFGYLPHPDDNHVPRRRLLKKMFPSQRKMMCLVAGPRKRAVRPWIGEDDENVGLAEFWNTVRRVEACWEAKAWAKENLGLKRAAMLEKLLQPDEDGPGPEE
jgi:hypothetical protein